MANETQGVDTGSGWSALGLKGLDILGDVAGAALGKQTSASGNPYPTSTNPQTATNVTQPPATATGALAGVPKWAIYGGIGLAALAALLLVFKAAKK